MMMFVSGRVTLRSLSIEYSVEVFPEPVAPAMTMPP